MLSEKKMVIGQSSIDFLRVNISDGKYTLQPHIASSPCYMFDQASTTSLQMINFLYQTRVLFSSILVSITSEDGFAMIVSYDKNYLPKT